MSAKKQPRNGKPVSTATTVRSATKVRYLPSPDLRRALTSVYNRYQKLPDRVANAQCREDFVFHMTDWLRDLERLKNCYDHPKTTKDSAGDVVYGFLLHALPHLMEAGRLLEGREIQNPFLPVGCKQ